MPSLPVIKTLFRELLTTERSPRINEPDLVMDDPEKVAAYTRAGREDGVMAPVYLYHCAQICDVVRAGDRVIDLGCGPATQLAMAARLNPDTHFTGLDLSEQMLQRATAHCRDMQLGNVEFQRQNISSLTDFESNSVDVVMSTVALHHLPQLADLESTFAEVARVLKPDGGLYIVDFGHLKAEKSIEYFAYQYADSQAELFTLDYLYSLRAAFARDDFARLTSRYLADRARAYSTFLMPFKVAIKSLRRDGEVAPFARRELQRLRDELPAHHRTDLADLRSFFSLGGLKSPLLQ